MSQHVSPSRANTHANFEQRRPQIRGLRRLFCVLTVLLLGLLCCSIPHSAVADIPPGDHVYLYTSNGPVDVTNTYYNSNGQDYVVYGDPIPVELDFAHGHVYDLFDNVIGYIYVPPSPPG